MFFVIWGVKTYIVIINVMLIKCPHKHFLINDTDCPKTVLSLYMYQVKNIHNKYMVDSFANHIGILERCIWTC